MLPCAGSRVKHRLWAFAEWPVPGRAMLIRRHLVLGAAACGTLAPTLVACSSSTGEQEAARVGGMGGTFLGLAVALAAEAGRAEQSTHSSSAQFMPLQGQPLRQFVRALARPAQRRHRVATGGRIDRPFEAGEQVRVDFRQPLAPGSWTGAVAATPARPVPALEHPTRPTPCGSSCATSPWHC